MSGFNLSDTEKCVLGQIRDLNNELGRLEEHRREMTGLETQIWSARSVSPAGTPGYGLPGGSYGPNIPAAAAYVPQASQGLEARLEEIRQAASGVVVRISQLVRSLEDQGGEIQRYHNEVNENRVTFSSRRGQLHGKDPKISYHKGEDQCLYDLRKCDEILSRINGVLRRAGAAVSGGSPPCLIGGPAPTRPRCPADYACDGVRDETLYALAKKRDEEIDSPSEPPSPHLGVLREQRTGGLADKIAAGQGYAKMPVADEYKVPLPPYYYRLYRGECSPDDGQGRFLMME